jgi:hypothetical protein
MSSRLSREIAGTWRYDRLTEADCKSRLHVKWTPFLGPWRERTVTKKTRRRIDAGLKAKVALESPPGKGDGR